MIHVHGPASYNDTPILDLRGRQFLTDFIATRRLVDSERWRPAVQWLVLNDMRGYHDARMLVDLDNHLAGVLGNNEP
jgi:hypothetical protein